MKFLLNLCCGASLAFVTVLAADGLGLAPFAKKENPKDTNIRRVAYTQEADPFGPHVKTKVVQYFETYQADPMGLPEGCASRLRDGEVPAGWTAAGISRGTVIGEKDRHSLVEIPAELVRMLPADGATVRYFLAGSHLVAVDTSYKVLDTIPIPTVRLKDGAPGPAARLHLVSHGRDIPAGR